MIVGKPCGVSRTIRKPGTSPSSACPRMRWRASGRRPLPRGATSSMPNRSNSRVWSRPFGACSRPTNRCSDRARQDGATPGRRTVKTEPLPSSLVTVTSPPIMRASLRVMASPSPVPPNFCAVEASAWLNSSNSFACCSAVMPMPVSETANSTKLLPLLTLHAASLTSPALVNLQALLRRLSRICRSRMGSTVRAPRFSWASTTSRFLFCSASCPAVPTTSSISGAFEGAHGRFAHLFITFGRVPFFYYVVHIFLIHALAVVLAWLVWGDASWLFGRAPIDKPANYGLSLPGVYAVWLLVLLALYPLCLWFAGLNPRHTDRWWSYP